MIIFVLEESEMTGNEIVKTKVTPLAGPSGMKLLLSQIRPAWKSKRLIERVEALMSVDPSSACQRIFNAAIHDLKEKIVVAGLDIAAQAAVENKMPAITKAEDIENLDVTRTIGLAYHMGLLTHPEWRRFMRVYDIRRDLEHEDDQYEATPEDCFYIFKTSIDVVLSKDPVEIIKLQDVKAIIEQPSPVTLSLTVLDDYKCAPIPRQKEIFYFLISVSLNTNTPDLVRQNSYKSLGELRETTSSQVIIEASNKFFGNRNPLSETEARVAFKAGIFPYLKQTKVMDFFKSYLSNMQKIGYSFQSHKEHGELLSGLQEIGGLEFCPEELLPEYLRWLVLCYIGERSYGQFARSSKAFYSYAGAPLALEIMKTCRHDKIPELMEKLRKNKEIKAACAEANAVARRFEDIVDAIGES